MEYQPFLVDILVNLYRNFFYLDRVNISLSKYFCKNLKKTLYFLNKIGYNKNVIKRGSNSKEVITMTLTRQEIQNINCRMLGMGAPVVEDGVGYNQVHFGFMEQMSRIPADNISNKQLTTMIKFMLVYKNTQLASFAKDLQDTLASLGNELEVKTQPVVKVVSYDTESVQITWKFNRSVSDAIKNSDRNNFRWLKIDNQWILKLYWDRLDEYLDIFVKNDFDVSAIQEALLKSQDIELKDESGQSLEVVYELEVERPDNEIDTLAIRVNFHPVIYQVLRNIPFASLNKTQGIWTIRIDESSNLYSALEKCGKTVDLNQLLPWKKLVDSWNRSFEMIDLSKKSLKFTPYPFQLEDVKKMLTDGTILNANDMGCGKTFESVVVGESVPMKKLVICPATLRLNWYKEIKMVTPDADVSVLYNDKPVTIGDWTIVGYPSVAKFQKELEAENFQCIFIDEAHYCQAINNSGTPDSNRAKAVLRLAATAGWVYPLTGTPKTNRNKNLFNTLRLIRHPLAKGQWAFNNYGREYCDGVKGSWGWDFEGNSNDDQLYEQLKPFMIRHLKKEVLPNLKKQRVIIPVNVDLTEYNYEISQYLMKRESKEAEQLARLARARQILARQKVGETIDFAKEFISDGKKIVIVTCFTDVVKTVEKSFAGNVVKLVGGMSDKQKNEAIQEFQEGEKQVMVMNIIAGGVGVTLTKSWNIIFNDYDFVPGNVVQAEDRICRGGQTAECCMVYYINALGADVEEEFVDLLTYKSETINNAIDGGNGESIDFRSLVEKFAGNSRSDKVRRILSANEIKTQENKNTTPVKVVKDVPNFSEMSLEELKNKILEMGGTPKTYDNANITRMRMVMQLKKLMA